MRLFRKGFQQGQGPVEQRRLPVPQAQGGTVQQGQCPVQQGQSPKKMMMLPSRNCKEERQSATREWICE